MQIKKKSFTKANDMEVLSAKLHTLSYGCLFPGSTYLFLASLGSIESQIEVDVSKRDMYMPALGNFI
jgi:hypothetical protein